MVSMDWFSRIASSNMILVGPRKGNRIPCFMKERLS